MKIDYLESLSHEELLSTAEKRGVVGCEEKDDKELMKALATFPENDYLNCSEYVDEANVGDLVAFRTKAYNVKSAKIVSKDNASKKACLETKYGMKFTVDFEDIIWVNTNGHWPKWVYNLLKGKYHESSRADA